ncbi:hypothetical protein L1987_19897 [Smallanthus sonchifolius]|uniref:Uncharacterized protein n=1 Tax=Smallanthus sonchifolius TaxID=185202 RepID=A0ACB9IS54_9ASTR|nr:hypothetical protein L1987_19897 [Smallanthus sonchifolius]
MEPSFDSVLCVNEGGIHRCRSPLAAFVPEPKNNRRKEGLGLVDLMGQNRQRGNFLGQGRHVYFASHRMILRKEMIWVVWCVCPAHVLPSSCLQRFTVIHTQKGSSYLGVLDMNKDGSLTGRKGVSGTYLIKHGHSGDIFSSQLEDGIAVVLKRIYDVDHSLLNAFRGRGLALVIGVDNGWVNDMYNIADHILNWVREDKQAAYMPNPTLTHFLAAEDVDPIHAISLVVGVPYPTTSVPLMEHKPCAIIVKRVLQPTNAHLGYLNTTLGLIEEMKYGHIILNYVHFLNTSTVVRLEMQEVGIAKGAGCSWISMVNSDHNNHTQRRLESNYHQEQRIPITTVYMFLLAISNSNSDMVALSGNPIRGTADVVLEFLIGDKRLCWKGGTPNLISYLATVALSKALRKHKNAHVGSKSESALVSSEIMDKKPLDAMAFDCEECRWFANFSFCSFLGLSLSDFQLQEVQLL